MTEWVLLVLAPAPSLFNLCVVVAVVYGGVGTKCHKAKEGNIDIKSHLNNNCTN